MPKSKNDHIEKTAKLIFKNSRNTINTYSKTYSGASQVYTKSLILQLKQNLSDAEYYEDNGRVKRDLSIETDICILRGYYKKKRSRFDNRGTVSTKSKYSVNRTEIDTIDEFKYDSSACGDSKESVKLQNAHFNINLTSLVVQNFKKLLHDWVKEYLLDSDETKEKIESVLDSILHNLDHQKKESVSSCTYTVDIEVIDQTQNHISRPLDPRQGSLSVPLAGKCYRILSTLSVPKNMSRLKTSKFSWSKLNKIRHKKILLSANGSSKYLFTSSSLNFLTLPTKYLTKRCATYQQDIAGRNKNQDQELFTPGEFNGVENLASLAAFTRNSVFDTIPSIYKNIYKELRKKELPGPKNNSQSRNNTQEQDSNERIEFFNQRFDLVKNKQMKVADENSQLMSTNVDKKAKKVTRRSKKSISRMRKRKSFKSKKFTYYFRKSKNHTQHEKDLLYHFQSILKMISSHKCGEDVKLDIHVNVFPSSDSKTEKEVHSCEYSYPLISSNVNTSSKQKIINDDSVPHENNIIPLLDGALNQAKYIMSGEPYTECSENNNSRNSKAINCIAKDSQIAQEISELKMIIKSLASTTEKFVNDHLSKRNTNKVISNSHIDSKKEFLEDIEAKPSVGVQFSNRFVIKADVGSGIKLKKDPKKKHRDYNPRLIKRSTSYNIIDSESILKVTDMTSAAQGEINIRNRVDRAVTCSLPKTKSLFEMSCGNCDVKLSHIQCNVNPKPREYVYVFEHNNNKPHAPYKDANQHDKQCNEAKAKTEHNLESIQNVKSVECDDDETRSSTVIIDIETKTHRKKITFRPRTGIRFCEGCCYCILLWIPVLAILWLFHEYVLKHYLPEEFSLRRLILRSKGDYINESYLRITLADLGF